MPLDRVLLVQLRLSNRIGYARVSTGEQNLDLQLDALNNAGCSKIFTDQLSSAKTGRPGLTEALSAVAEEESGEAVPRHVNGSGFGRDLYQTQDASNRSHEREHKALHRRGHVGQRVLPS